MIKNNNQILYPTNTEITEIPLEENIDKNKACPIYSYNQIKHQEKYVACLQFYQENKTLPSRYSTNKEEAKLGEWLYRTELEPIRINSAQFQQLQEIKQEIEQNKTNQQIQNIFQEVEAFYQNNKHYPKTLYKPQTKEEKEEYNLAKKARTYLKQDQPYLTIKQISFLEQIGWFYHQTKEKIPNTEKKKMVTIEYYGENRTLHNIAKLENISYTTLSRYYKQTSDIEKAVLISKTVQKENSISKQNKLNEQKVYPNQKKRKYSIKHICLKNNANYCIIRGKIQGVAIFKKLPALKREIDNFHTNGQKQPVYFKYMIGNISLKHILLYLGIDIEDVLKLQQKQSITFYQAIWIYLIKNRKNDYPNSNWLSNIIESLYMVITNQEELAKKLDQITQQYKQKQEELSYIKTVIQDYKISQRQIQYIDWYTTLSLNQKYQKMQRYQFSKEDIIRAACSKFPFKNSILLPIHSIEFEKRKQIEHAVYNYFQILPEENTQTKKLHTNKSPNAGLKSIK